jgi:hypothetical protein
MMVATSRIVPVELSRKQIDGRTMQSKYKAGYGCFIVNSRFAGDKQFSDLFYEIIKKNLENRRPEQHNS